MRSAYFWFIFSSSILVAYAYEIHAQESQKDGPDIDQYLEATGLNWARGAIWCDPIPDCDEIILRTRAQATEDSVFILVIAPEGSGPSEEDIEFLKIFSESLQESNIEVLGIGVIPPGEFADSLRRRLAGPWQ